MTSSFAKPTRHGALTAVTDGVHCVRGTFRMGPGILIPRTMTVVETTGGLVVINSIRLDADGEAALARLGKVAHVVTLSDMHGLDDPYYVATFGAAYWTIPGARPKRLAVDRTLGAEVPVPGARFVAVPNPAAPEGALWLPHGGGTLVTCDVVQNHVDSAHASVMAKLVSPLLGFKGGVIVPKMWRRHHQVADADVATVLAPLTALAFEHLVTAHGAPVVGRADVAVRAAVASFAATPRS